MLRLALTIVPLGDEVLTRHIGTIEIARTTIGNDPEDYRAVVYDANGELVNIFTVKEHYYRDGAWTLARRAVEILTMPDVY